MWNRIRDRLADYPARLRVARKLVECGLAISEDQRVHCAGIEIPHTKLARSLGVDRRVVGETIRLILKDQMLKTIFSSMKPAGPFLASFSKILGFSVIEIYADPNRVGILARAAKIISAEKISIRQAVAEDPDLAPEPKLTLVIEKQLSGAGLQQLLRIPGVEKLTAY